MDLLSRETKTLKLPRSTFFTTDGICTRLHWFLLLTSTDFITPGVKHFGPVEIFFTTDEIRTLLHWFLLFTSTDLYYTGLVNSALRRQYIEREQIFTSPHTRYVLTRKNIVTSIMNASVS